LEEQLQQSVAALAWQCDQDILQDGHTGKKPQVLEGTRPMPALQLRTHVAQQVAFVADLAFVGLQEPQSAR